MVVLPLILVPAGHFFLFRLLLLPGDLIYSRGERLLSLLIEILVFLSHVGTPGIGCADAAASAEISFFIVGPLRLVRA